MTASRTHNASSVQRANHEEGTALAVPVIDLWSHGSVDAVADACARLGFFKVVNHGIPAELVEKLEAEALAFFSLQVQEKRTLASDPAPPPPASSSFRLGYGHKNIGANGDAGSVEYLLLSLASNNFVSTSALPAGLRCAVAEYAERVREVADRVLRLVAQGLGMRDTAAFSRMVRRDGSDELLRVNNYPPEARAKTTGFGEHTDPQIISVLRSNSVPGLQVALRDGSCWLPVQPDPDALFVIVGDTMQVMTNGRYRSARHRVVVASEASGKRARLSMIYFAGPAPWERIAPVSELVREGEASLYRSFTWGEYKAAACKTRLRDPRLDRFRASHF
ncbi:hypothetical protein QOZ80_1AG0028220 [Eleusine coracana subsp. coracana]|nr:hypothetical protein QOZ80_1AG0028220 [Eleusine coracana subsp. coracana]